MRRPALRLRSRRIAAALAATSWAAAALGTVSCGRGGDAPATDDRARPQGGGVPGIVLVCLDTLRADALDASSPMPALKAFAATATVYRDASTSAAWTPPAIATLLTGLVPARHGVRGTLVPGEIPPAVTTLAEVLAEQGWSTAASTGGGWVDAGRGYAQGFSKFDGDFDSKPPEDTVAAWQAARAKDAPFFLFLHSYAPHDPYGDKALPLPPRARMDELVEEARAQLAGVDAASGALSDETSTWLLGAYLMDRARRTAVGRVVGADRLLLVKDRVLEWLDEAGPRSPSLAALLPKAARAYRDGTAYADRVFARTLEALDRASLPEGTVIAVVGDHGEMLGEHGTLSHRRWLYDEVLRVPLVVRAPGRLPRGAVAGSCGLVDVAPTLFDLARVSTRAVFDGVSLVPLARGEAKGHPVVAEEDRRAPRSPAGTVWRSMSVRTEAAKYVLTVDARTQRVEGETVDDLVADPREANPAPFAPPSVAARGEDFCRAVARVRADLAGLTEALPCGR